MSTLQQAQSPPENRSEQDVARLTLSGAIGLEEVLALKDEALALLERPGDLEIRLDGVERMHATAFQLLFCLDRAKDARGGALVLDGPVPECVRAEALRLGVDSREFAWLFGGTGQ